MPGMDGTGPRRQGSGMGRGTGLCGRGAGVNCGRTRRMDGRFNDGAGRDMQTLESDEKWLESLLRQVRDEKARLAETK